MEHEPSEVSRMGSNMSGLCVAVIGQGYVGLPLAMRAVEVGFDVIGFDTDIAKIEILGSGRSHIEDVSADQVQVALASRQYRPTADLSDLAGFDVAVISVPTPLKNGAPDLSFVESASRSVGSHLRAGALVVLESTTFPGTTADVVAPILEEASGLRAGADFALGFSPERIDPGNTVWTFERTPKIVSGVDAASLARVEEFFNSLVTTTVPASGTREAEMAKLLENTFRHVNIALVNELAILAWKLGVDIWEVIRVASSKPFGFMAFTPGPGVGGHCLPIDPSYLSWQFERELGEVSRFVKIADEVNARMPAHVAERVLLGLNARTKPARDSVVLILGVAYKKNSSDCRETPATGIIDRLVELGSIVFFHDPMVDDFHHEGAEGVPLSKQQLSQADAVVLVTDHDDIDYELVSQHAKYVLDTRHRMTGEAVEYL